MPGACYVVRACAQGGRRGGEGRGTPGDVGAEGDLEAHGFEPRDGHRGPREEDVGVPDGTVSACL